MSLDFWLTEDGPRLSDGNEGRIFIRRNGRNTKITREEWDRLNPGQEPVLFVGSDSQEIFSANITHNLGKMAEAAGIYAALWHPGDNGIRVASEMINFLEDGLARLKSEPERYRAYNSPNGWGLYEHFVPFVEEVLSACREHPTAKINVSI